MLLNFGGSKFQVHVEEEISFASKHTGASLGHLKVETTIRGKDANDEFLLLIDRAKIDGINSIDENDNIQKQWKIGNTSWSYQEGSPIYHHKLELMEIEKINLSSLELGALALQPYEYKESFNDDILMIDMKVAISESQNLQIRAMQKSKDYFPVIRHGVSEEPKQMRFGLCYWSQHDTEYKHQIVLVEKGQETKPNQLSAFQWMWPLRRQVADNTATIDLLLDMLRNKNVLTEEEVVTIRNDISERSWNTLFGFFRVEDIDKV